MFNELFIIIIIIIIVVVVVVVCDFCFDARLPLEIF
jgi:hypothetical protein